MIECPLNPVERHILGDTVASYHRHPLNVILLGNKKQLKEGALPYSAWFKELGCEVRTIDMTGEDGALAYDLRKPVRPYWDWADYVINFGTLEHVSEQRHGFANAHAMCKVGGRIIHTLPEVGGLLGHCDWYYSKHFVKWMAERNGYVVEDFCKGLMKGDTPERPVVGQLLCIRYHVTRADWLKWEDYPPGLYWGPTEKSVAKRAGYYPVAKNILNRSATWE